MKKTIKILVSVLLTMHFLLAYSCVPSFVAVPSPFMESSWPYSFEGLIIMLLLSLIVYNRMERINMLVSTDKLNLVMHVVNCSRTPLTLMHHQLEDIASYDLPDPVSEKVERALCYAGHVVDCYKNMVAFGDLNETCDDGSSMVESELSGYITSVINKCRKYAEARHVHLKVGKNFGFLNILVNERVMTSSLFCLLTKMIDLTPSDGRINIMVSRFSEGWSLRVTNCPKGKANRFLALGRPFALMQMRFWWSLRPIKKLIRLHGGKIVGLRYGRLTTLQIIFPVVCHCVESTNSNLSNETDIKDGVASPVGGGSMEEDSSDSSEDKLSSVFLVMEDKDFSDYLQESLCRFFRVKVVENPDVLPYYFEKESPDAVIVDEMVNGVCGDLLCSRIKSDSVYPGVPVLLLVNSDDYLSYVSHARCGADRVEVRMVNICRLQVDIQLLIEQYMLHREQIKKILLGSPCLSNLPDPCVANDEDVLFLQKVQGLLENNLSKEGYTVGMLASDMCMSRTAFYTRLTSVTGKSPIDYMRFYKMSKAKELLASNFDILEISIRLGFSDPRYFSKKFRDFYGVAPTKYFKKLAEEADAFKDIPLED